MDVVSYVDVKYRLNRLPWIILFPARWVEPMQWIICNAHAEVVTSKKRHIYRKLFSIGYLRYLSTRWTKSMDVKANSLMNGKLQEI